MEIQSKARIGLTQFINFSTKGSSAKINEVKKIKYQDSDYHPAKDYWKQLRDAIIKFHEQGLNLEYFDFLLEDIDDKKKVNYQSAVKQYISFIKKKDIEWFPPGKSIWTTDQLSVRSSPELGLIINGEPHLIKLYFKGKREKIDKRNINSTLTLLNTSTYEIGHDPSVNKSVLNLHNQKLYTNNDFDAAHLLALQAEANQFVYIWDNI